MKRQFDESRLTNDALCRECGGECCNRCGCSYFPKDFDFELNFDNLISEIDKGYIAIDAMFYSESIYDRLDVPIYYLRVRNVNDTTPIGINSLGVCKRLEKDHCYFDLKDRPSGGKFFIPFWSGCYTLYTQQEFIDSWMPYQKLVKLLIEHYKNQ